MMLLTPRFATAVWLLLALIASLLDAPAADAACNLIPGTKAQFDGAQGTVNRSFAAPGEAIEVALRTCDDSPGLGTVGEDQLVTLIYTPTTGPETAVVLTGGSDCAAVNPLLAGCAGDLPAGGKALCVAEADSKLQIVDRDGVPTLSFRLPDTDARCSGGADHGTPCVVSGDCQSGVCSPDDDDRTLTGAVRIVVTDASAPLQCGISSCDGATGTIACIDTFYRGGGGCAAAAPEAVFPSFTALPPPNLYAQECVEEQPPCAAVLADEEIRFALDSRGNILLPFVWDGIRAILDGTPVARLVTSTIAAPITLPGTSFVQSFAPEGRRLNPVFEPKETNGTHLVLFGSADAPYTILRISRGTDAGAVCSGGANDGGPCNEAADCPDGTCEQATCVGGTTPGQVCFTDEYCEGGGTCGPKLFDFSFLLSEGGISSGVAARAAGPLPGFCQDKPEQACAADCGVDGPCVLYKLEAGAPVPLDDLVARDELADFAITERIDGVDRNGDGDTADVVITERDPVTGELIPLGPPPSPPSCGIPVVPGTVDGRAVLRVSAPPARFPAGATEGDILAFVESESGQNGCDLTGDGDLIDGVLRVFRAPATELTGTTNRGVDPTPVVDGRSVSVSNGRVFYRSSELEQTSYLAHRYNTTAAGGEALGGGLFAGIAPATDGNSIAFLSLATNLDGGSGATSDVFVKDILSGAIRRFSVDAFGGNANANVLNPDIDVFGLTNYVVYSSGATDLITPDLNGITSDIFLATGTLAAGQTSIDVISEVGGVWGNGGSFDPSVGRDFNGRWVAYETNATNLVTFPVDTNGVTDIVMRRTDLAATELVSISTVTGAANGISENPDVAPYSHAAAPAVAFESEASNLVAGDTNGVRDVFVRSSINGNSATRRASVATGGGEANGISRQPSVTVGAFDQRTYVAFDSLATNLVPGDTNGAHDVFVHIVDLGITERVSVVTGGEQANAESFSPTISEDGRYVAFLSSATNLASEGDTNGQIDVFVHDRVTRSTSRVNVTSAGAQTAGDAFSGGAPAIGLLNTLVVYSSLAADVVPGDTNAGFDIFGRQIDISDLSADAELFPDGLPIDSVLQVFDTNDAVPTLHTLCPAEFVVTGGGKTAFLREEHDSFSTPFCPSGDLTGNNEVELDDRAVTFWDGGAPVNLGKDAKLLAMSEEWIAIIRADDDSPFTEALLVHEVCDPISACDWEEIVTPITTVGTSFIQPGSELTVNGSAITFYVYEGPPGLGTDLNGDGFLDDYVLYVYDADSQVLHATGLAGVPDGERHTNARYYATGDRVSSVACGSDVQLVAFEVDESEAAQDANLNSGTGLPADTDDLDRVLHVLDVVSGEIINVGQAVTPCAFSACDPRHPWRVEGTKVTFLTSEVEQGGQDLSGDGDALDLVLQTFDFCTEVTIPYGPVDPNADSDPFGTQDDSQVITADAGRCDQGITCGVTADCAAGHFCEDDVCNVPFGTCARHSSIGCASDADCSRCIAFVPGSCVTDDDCLDGDTCEAQVVTAVTDAGDRDFDGIPDGLDNCPDDPNPTQSNHDGDAFGDACDAHACSATPVAGCRQPGADKAKLVMKDGTPNKKDLIKLAWAKGEVVTLAELGDPLVTDSFDLCVYDDDGFVTGATAPAGAVCKKGKPCWKEISAGFKYKNPSKAPSGMLSLLLKSSDTPGKSKATAVAKGENLVMPGLLDLAGDIRVQVVNHGTGLCLEAEFAPPFKKHQADKLVATGGPAGP